MPPGDLARAARSQVQRTQTAQVQRQPGDLARAARGEVIAEAEGGGSGVLHELSNIKDMALAVPSGLFGLSQDVLKTAHSVARTPITLAAGAAGEALGVSREEQARRLNDTLWGAGNLAVDSRMLGGQIQADPQAKEGIGQFIPRSGEASAIAREIFPFFHATGASLSSTVNRGTDFVAAANPIGMGMDIAAGRNPLDDLRDTQYAELGAKGEFAPAALEDIANLALLAEGGGVAAGRLAGRVEGRLASLADDAIRADAQAAVPSGMRGMAGTPGVEPALVAEQSRLAGRAAGLRNLEEGFSKAAHLTGRAGDLPATMWKAPGLVGETMGGRFGLFSKTPAGSALERLVPFGQEGTRTGLVGYMRDRGTARLVENLDKTDLGAKVVDWWSAHPAEAARNVRIKMQVNQQRRDLENSMQDAQSKVARRGVLATRAAHVAAKKLGAEVVDVENVPMMMAEQTTQSLMEMFDDPDRMLVVTNTLADEGLIPAPDPRMAREYLIATSVGPENVTAFKIADQYRRGTMDPDAALWLERSDERLRENRGERQERFLADEGEKTAPDPARIVRHQEQLLNEPMPSVTAEIRSPAEQRVAQQEELYAAAEKDFLKSQERLLIPDEEYRSPMRQQAASVASAVPDDVLRRSERVAERQGASDYAQRRAESLFSRPLRETATTGDLVGGARGQLRAEQDLGRARRDQGAAAERSFEALDVEGNAAIPKAEGLFQGGLRQDRSVRPAERAAAAVEQQMGPAPTTKKARRAEAKASIEEVRRQVFERIDAEAADLSRESAQKFGYEALPDLPFLPPLLRDAIPQKRGGMDWWTEMDPAAQKDFAGRYMAKETTDARRLRAEQEFVYNRRNPGKHLFADWESLENLHRSTPKAARPALKGKQDQFRDPSSVLGNEQAFIDIAGRHRAGMGAEASEIGPNVEVGAVGATNWVDDWARIADEQRLAAEKRRALEGTARGQNRENVNIELDALDPESFAQRGEIGEGYQWDVLTPDEVAAVVRGFDEDGNPLTETQREQLMMDALEAKRGRMTADYERMVTEQLDRAFEGDYSPWEWSPDEFADTVAQVRRGIDEAGPGEGADLIAADLALTPDVFGDPNNLTAQHEAWLAAADERGVERHRDLTPDQVADRAVADVISRVTDAFDQDAGTHGAGWESLSKRERVVYREMERAAEVVDRTQVAADARAKVAELKTKVRRGITDDVLEREARKLQADADRLGSRAQAQKLAASRRTIEDIAARITKDQRRVGERQAEYKAARRTLKGEERKLFSAQDRLAKVAAAAELDPRATPARYTGMMKPRDRAATELREVGAGNPIIEALADDIGRIDVRTLAELGDPEHVISGRKSVGRGGSRTMSTAPYTTETGARKFRSRTGGETDYSIRGQIRSEAQRVGEQVRNTGARAWQAEWGQLPSEIMGQRRRHQRDLGDVTDLSGRELAEAMDAEGWVAFDPGNITSRIPDGLVTQETQFIPKTVWQASQKMLNEQSDFMKAIEKWYDRRFMGTVKMWWLALSPRWLTANVVGNAIMATAGAGIMPHEYVKQIRNARALLAEEAPLEWQDGNRAQRRMFANRERLLAKGEELRRQGYEIPSEALNRGFTAEEIGFLRQDGVNEIRSPIRKAAAKSYELNEYTDNVSRSAIYLAKMEPRRKLMQAWDEGRISETEFRKGLSSTRDADAAIKQALRAAGDFSKLSAFEKQAVKRVWVFYPWYRHITKLVMSMPIYAPARTVWMLHLADVFGGDPDEERKAGAGSSLQRSLPGFAKGGIALGGNRQISSAGLNPFSTGLDSPFFSAEGMLGATTPALQWPAALLLGKDMKHGMRDFSRSPGSGNLDEYGRETNTPLWQDPSALLYQGLKQFPQGRLWQTARDEPILRYDTGEPMIVGGDTKETGRPSGPGGAALGLFGVPLPQDINAEDVANRRAKRQADQAKKRRRYEGQRERLGV